MNAGIFENGQEHAKPTDGDITLTVQLCWPIRSRPGVDERPKRIRGLKLVSVVERNEKVWKVSEQTSALLPPAGTTLLSSRPSSCGSRNSPTPPRSSRSGCRSKTSGSTWRRCSWAGTSPSSCLRSHDRHVLRVAETFSDRKLKVCL